MGTLLLLVGLVAVVVAYNALFPRFRPAGLAAVSFFAGWLTAELALHVVFLELVVVSALVWHGALATLTGKIGLAFALASLALLAAAVLRSMASNGVVEAALSDLFVHEAPRELDWRALLLPLPVRDRRVERLRDVPYFEDGHLRLRLDVFRQRGERYDAAARRPVLLYVHGGAWIIGDKRHQGLPMLHRFARRGWVCFSIDYRLSPRATFPDHIVDVKRAIAWVRAHAAEYGGDPGFIVVSGGSAGGHLASLAALTPERRDWQPGFADADTSVAACVSFYGIYDFGDHHGHWPNPSLRRILERYVLKARLDDAPARFDDASPIAHVGPGAPPFLVVHGTLDSLVPVAEARAFVAALEAAGAHPTYLEIPGAQHAFEIFPSLRTLAVLRGVERFARRVHDAQGGQATAGSPPQSW